VGPGVLREIVGAGEFLATLIAREGLILRVQGPEVSLEVFLASEASCAQVADESLRGVLGEGLLPTATNDWSRRNVVLGAAGI